MISCVRRAIELFLGGEIDGPIAAGEVLRGDVCLARSLRLFHALVLSADDDGSLRMAQRSTVALQLRERSKRSISNRWRGAQGVRHECSVREIPCRTTDVGGAPGRR